MFSFFKKTKETPKYEILHALKAIDYPENPYEGKTAEEIEQFQQRLQQTINDIIEEENTTIIAEKVNQITKERIDLREKLEKAEKEWGKRKEDIKKTVEKGVAFVQSTNFYPPEYVFHLNKIEGFILEMTELQEKDPLASAEEFFTFRDQVEQDITVFSELHQETIKLIDKIEQKIKEKEKQETQDMFEIKESLFRSLQMGNLVQAKSDLKKLRKEVKRF